jgi:hypothetical protein
LKIRNRSDLRNAIHWNGLDHERKAVMTYYERACSLNQAHRILAQRPPHVLQTFNRKLGGVGEVEGCPKMAVDDLAYQYLVGSGGRLLDRAWRMQWILETELQRFCRLTGRAPGSDICLKAIRTTQGEFKQFAWEDHASGCLSPSLHGYLPVGLVKGSPRRRAPEQTENELRR